MRRKLKTNQCVKLTLTGLKNIPVVGYLTYLQRRCLPELFDKFVDLENFNFTLPIVRPIKLSISDSTVQNHCQAFSNIGPEKIVLVMAQ